MSEGIMEALAGARPEGVELSDKDRRRRGRARKASDVLRRGLDSGRAVAEAGDVHGVLVVVITANGTYRQSWAMSDKARSRMVEEAGLIVKERGE